MNSSNNDCNMALRHRFPFDRLNTRSESVEAEPPRASFVGIDASASRLLSLSFVEGGDQGNVSSTNSYIPTIVDTCPAVGTIAQRRGSEVGDGPSGMSPLSLMICLWASGPRLLKLTPPSRKASPDHMWSRRRTSGQSGHARQWKCEWKLVDAYGVGNVEGIGYDYATR